MNEGKLLRVFHFHDILGARNTEKVQNPGINNFCYFWNCKLIQKPYFVERIILI